MCRIAGIVDRSNSDLQHDILTMRDAMEHGGPDDAGIFLDSSAGVALGHRRLSIIDLSQAGHQPMQHDDIVLVFNGEIYNFRELRSELIREGYHFSSNSDTEVIIRAYQSWGNSCFDRFRGMFALAIYDRPRQQLILARDHAGIKPLYYFLGKEKFYFASEIRAFNALGYWDANPEWPVYLLAYGFLPEPVTTLNNVRPLEKGSYLSIDLRDFSAKQETYYKPRFTNTLRDVGEAKQLLRTTLETSLKRHLISDAPIGLFLSGGIDSSLLTLLAQPVVGDSLRTLSLDFEDPRFSEKIYQDLIIKKTGASHQSFLIGRKDFEDSLDDIIRSMDQPSTDGINSYFICKYARKAGLKAVLSGLGADELLGGYPSFKRARHYPKLKQVPRVVLRMLGHLQNDKYRKFSFLQRKDPVGEYLFYRGYYVPAEISRMLGCSTAHVREQLAVIKTPAEVGRLSPGNRVSYLETNFYMQGQLLKDTDMMSMWHSVEVRVPFLDRDFMDAVYCIASDLKFDQPYGKFLLIETFKELLPREIWERKKQGFVLPFAAWMKHGKFQHTQGSGGVSQDIQRRFDSGKLSWSRYWAYVLATGNGTPTPTIIR